MDVIRVMVADDNPAVREEMPQLLAADGDIEVIGTVENGQDAVDLARRVLPDVVVMDVKMPILDGITATKMIKSVSPETRVVMLSIYDKAQYMKVSMEAGASAYIIKNTEIDTLANAIRRAFHERDDSKSARKINKDEV